MAKCQEKGTKILLRLIYSRLTRQAKQKPSYHLKDRSFSQVKRELGVDYATLRRFLERETPFEKLKELSYDLYEELTLLPPAIPDVISAG